MKAAFLFLFLSMVTVAYAQNNLMPARQAASISERAQPYHLEVFYILSMIKDSACSGKYQATIYEKLQPQTIAKIQDLGYRVNKVSRFFRGYDYEKMQFTQIKVEAYKIEWRHALVKK